MKKQIKKNLRIKPWNDVCFIVETHPKFPDYVDRKFSDFNEALDYASLLLYERVPFKLYRFSSINSDYLFNRCCSNE